MPDEQSEHLIRRIDQLEAVANLTTALFEAGTLEQIYERALETLQSVLQVERASILLFGADQRMHFRAWRGLSSEYRHAVDGHSPWSPDAVDPEPIMVEDAAIDPSIEPYRPTLLGENIRALAFIPLVDRGQLLGKFMLYYDRPHRFDAEEISLARMIAGHVALRVHQKVAEERLRESRDQLEVILEGVADGITVQDPSSRLVFANTAAAVATGYATPAELCAAGLEEVMERFELFDEKGEPLNPDELPGRRALAGENPPDQLIQFRARNTNELRWSIVKSTPVFDPDGRVRFAVNIFRDVTKRYRAEESTRLLARAGELLASRLDDRTTLRALARLVVPALADWCAIDLLDEQGEIRRLALVHADPDRMQWAEQVQARFAAPKDGDSLLVETIRTGTPRLVREVDDALLESQAINEEHLRILREAGLTSAMIVPLSAQGGTFGAMTLIRAESRPSYDQSDLRLVSDLARRAALSVANARLYREAQAANRAKEDFLATLSHELRTPMTATLGWARMLRIGLEEPETVRTAAEAIDRSTRAQARIVDDILDVSRIVTGKIRIEPRPVDLIAIIDTAIEAIRSDAESKDLRLESSLSPLPLLVSGDSGRLQQVLWNLLSNAIKFTPAGGRIHVTTETAEGLVRVRVSDSGCGIAPDLLPHVFDRFRQADSSSKRSHGGLGLGLSIARHLVELHEGRITAESEGDNKGATLTVELPLVAETGVPVSPPARKPELPSLANLRLLVVEDDEETRRIISTLLAGCGAEVRSAGSVSEAVEVLETWAPDVVVSDLALPEHDGFELIERIRLREGNGQPRIPAIAVTAFVANSDRERARERGFDLLLQKPFEPVELARSIARLVE